LVTDPSIQAIGEMLSIARPNWAKLAEKNPLHHGNIGNLQGGLAERHIQGQLDDITSTFADVCQKPDLSGIVNPPFSFVRNLDGNIVVIKEEKIETPKGIRTIKNYVTDYDDIRIINGRPVVFEVKTLNPEAISEETLFGEEWYRRILHPLQEIFGDEFGLVVVTIPEIFDHTNLIPGINPSGVHFYTMNTSRQELKDHAIGIISPKPEPEKQIAA
jgi:hypothetical protein